LLGTVAGASLASAEVLDQNDVKWFSSLHEGRIASGTHRTRAIAEGLPEVAAGIYELRALAVPSIRVDALWLKNKGTGDDLIVPIASSSPVLAPDQPYNANDFLDRVRPLAVAARQFDNSPRNPSP
jgi:hypothetical protein